LRNIGIAYSELDQIDSSMFYYKKSLEYYEKNSLEYLCVQGDIKLYEGKIKEGIKFLKKANRLNPENVIANNSLGLIYLGEYGEEYTDYERALHYNLSAFEEDNGATMKTVLAYNYYQLREDEKAIKLYKELIDFNSKNSTARFYLGDMLYESGAKEEAKKVYTELSKDTSYNEQLREIYTEFEITILE